MRSMPSVLVRLLLAIIVAAGLTLVACVSNPQFGISGWWSERGPVVPHSTFPADCALCHTADSWTEMRPDFEYDHEKETGFRLVGAHAAAQCLRCHNDRGPVQYFMSKGCAGCHSDVHQGRLGNRCLDCHNQTDWQPSGQLAEHARTRLPLLGAHAALTCDRCHSGIASGQIDPLSTECASCHQDDLAEATSPDHFAQGWVRNCEQCHRETGWGEEGFVHDFFPLTGGHDVSCASCHPGRKFAALPTSCESCHAQEFATATDPDHVGLNLPMDCERCHDIQGWSPAGFDHSWVTVECLVCHEDEYLNTQNPDHQLWGYSDDCAQCHGTEHWNEIHYSHSGVADGCSNCHLQDFLATEDPDHQLWGYPTSCELCHHQFDAFPPADFFHIGVVDGCVQCHLQDYLATTDPDHQELGFPLDCEFCHVPDTSWTNPGPDGNRHLHPLRPAKLKEKPPAKGKSGSGKKDR